MSPLINPAQGKILVSEPFLNDFYFKRSIVLLAEHNDEGTFGLVLNKPTDIKLSEIFNDKTFRIPEDFDNFVYLGGPVKTDSLFFIHTRNDLINKCIKIIDGLYWGGDINLVNQLIEARTLSKNDIRFYIGYSGWEPKQLDRELDEHSWVVANTNVDFLLKNPPDTLWKNAVKLLGKKYSDWVNYPIDPQLN
ncbi:MAG TPA: YqgE/AlgH family protein [Bacteroidales bacterium]|nr:YqgE/AlgH family protein [Bacteroidales bacterium]